MYVVIWARGVRRVTDGPAEGGLGIYMYMYGPRKECRGTDSLGRHAGGHMGQGRRLNDRPAWGMRLGDKPTRGGRLGVDQPGE